MTVNQALTRISEDLDDSGLTFFSQADLLAALQNAYNKVSLLLFSNETTYTITLDPDVPYYNLSDLIPYYYAVFKAYNKSNQLPLVFKTAEQLNKIRTDYELWRGNPYYITVVDYRRVGFFPVPTSNVNILLHIKLASDNIVAGNDPLRIPAHAEDILLNTAKVELLEMAEEIYKAADLQNTIVGDFKISKSKANGRAMPNLPISPRGVDVSLMRKVVDGV